MTITMHQALIPTTKRALTNLKHLLQKAAEHAEASKIDPSTLIQFRLYPNMLPLKWQVYIATDTAKFAASRLGEIDPPSFEDTQETFDELCQRIDKTIEFLDTVEPSRIDGSETKTVVLKRRSGDLEFTGIDYLLGYALPNLYFHVTTVHAILRHNGVNVGKQDFLGKV